MLLPLAKSIFVFCGLKTMPAGSLWAKAAIREMILLVWRQEGPTIPIAAFGCVTAYFRSSADMVSVLPLCLHQRAAVNWLFSKISANSF
jgi:hypothetical protein